MLLLVELSLFFVKIKIHLICKSTVHKHKISFKIKFNRYGSSDKILNLYVSKNGQEDIANVKRI